MKKFLAILLAALLVLVNVAALAESDAGIPDIGDAVENLEKGATKDAETEPEYSIKKTYTTTGFATDVYPTETLEFEVTPAVEDYPAITVGDNNTFAVDGTTNEYTIPVNVPDASEYQTLGAGRYHYTVVETDPQDDPSQAVTYSTKTFNVDVYAYFTEDGFIREAVIYSGEEVTDGSNPTTKEDAFANEYKVGALKVGKTIVGNLADPDKEFSITVTLTSDNTVANDLVLDKTGGGEVTGAVAKGEKSYEFEVTVKGGQYIQINNIPDGVNYTVVENDITNITAAQQLEEANNTEAYTIEGQVTSATALAAGTTATEVTITNTKEIEIPEGIALDTVPYVLIMVLALIGLAVAARKREQY